jgi:hypothetical protein
MAENETVELEDDAEIVIDVPGDGGGEQPGDKGEATAALADRQEEAADALKEDASEALAQAIRTAEEAKRAAEATAASERARREDAERRAAQREAEAQAAVERAETSEIAVITHGIEAATREVAAYGSAFQKAMEDGEFAKATEAQVALGKATSKLDRLEAQKADYESGKTKRGAPARDAGGPVESTAPSRQNVVEAYLSGYDLQAQNWLRAHPECLPPRVRTPDGAVLELGGDQKKHNMMMAGHHDALAKGYALNSEDYFRTIEEHTGHRKAAEASVSTNNKGGVVPESRAARTRPASPSAPVSRSDTPGETPRSPTRVTLNRDQQEAARISYPHKTTKEAYALYAKELIEAQKEGKIGRLTH